MLEQMRQDSSQWHQQTLPIQFNFQQRQYFWFSNSHSCQIIQCEALISFLISSDVNVSCVLKILKVLNSHAAQFWTNSCSMFKGRPAESFFDLTMLKQQHELWQSLTG